MIDKSLRTQKQVTAMWRLTHSATHFPVCLTQGVLWHMLSYSFWGISLAEKVLAGAAIGFGTCKLPQGASPYRPPRPLAGPLVLDSLTVGAGATLDVANGDLVVDYDGGSGPSANVTACIRSGLNLGAGGYWDGNGIASSAAAAGPNQLTAVGVLDNADPEVGGKTEFAGQAVDDTSVLVKYTWWGDANLDGVVDANDYDVIDRNFLFNRNPSAPWFTGDFNYDGVIDANDYDKIDRAFLFQTGPLAPAAAAPFEQPTPATEPEDEADLLAVAVASGTIVRPLGPGEEPGAATALPIAAAAVAIPETEASTLNGIKPEVDAGAQPDADRFVWEEGPSPDRSGAMPRGLADDLVDVLDLVPLEVPLGV